MVVAIKLRIGLTTTLWNKRKRNYLVSRFTHIITMIPFWSSQICLTFCKKEAMQTMSSIVRVKECYKYVAIKTRGV